MTIHWSPRWPPLEPLAVVGEGAAASALINRLADDARLPTWTGVFGDGVVVLLGADLPWCEGVEYFGRESAESWLLVPTSFAPDVPVSWVEHRYRAAAPRVGWPCVLTRGGALIPVGNAAPIDRSKILALSLTLAPEGETEVGSR